MTVQRWARGARAITAAATLAAFGAAAIGSVAQAATQPCSGLQIIDARGTGEPGTYGTVVGDQLVADLQSDVPGTTAYAVNYPATTNEPSSVEAGQNDLVNHLKAQAAACPSEKFVLAGYSQGANVVAGTTGLDTSKAVVGGPSVAQIPSSLTSRIVALLQFGPPYNQVHESIPAPYSSVTDQYCATGDAFCDPNPNPVTGVYIHVTAYKPDLSPAAAYAAQNYKGGRAA